jgi:CheY-like chemotaxis protein
MSKESHRVRLVSWKPERAREIAADLEAGGFEVDHGAVDNAALKALAASPPDAVVIDLGRLPAQGRDFGIMIRTRASTRSVPVVFVDGTAEKIARTKEHLPDAVYTDRSNLSFALAKAITNPPADPVVPASNLAGYSGTPLPKKLGIKQGSTVALVEAPDDFPKTLERLPAAVTLTQQAIPDADVTLWFVHSLEELSRGIESMAHIAGGGRLWICWPKKASDMATDVTQNEVRARGLATGIVDFKICAVDATWSGLCFTRRKK